MKLYVEEQFKTFLEANNINIFTKDNYNNNYLRLADNKYVEVLEQIDQVINEQAIIALSTVSNISQFVPLFYACLSTANGLECIEMFKKYKKTIAPLDITIEEDCDTVEVSIEISSELDQQLPRFSAVNEMLLVIDLISSGVGRTIKPLVINGKHDISFIADHINTRVNSNSNINSVVFKKEDLLKPFIRNNQCAYGLNQIINKLDIDLKNYQIENQLIDLIQEEVIRLLPSGEATLSKICSLNLINERTVQRRLKEEKLSYSTILKTTRKSLAEYYIKLDMPTDEIAILLGYRDTSSFVRAFKSIMGTSISSYKMQLL